MYSAIILVCLNGHKLYTHCDSYVSTYFFETKAECILNIADTIEKEYFDFYIDEENSFAVVDFRCINWNEMRV